MNKRVERSVLAHWFSVTKATRREGSVGPDSILLFSVRARTRGEAIAAAARALARGRA